MSNTINGKNIIQDKLFPRPFSDLEKGIDYRVKRQTIIASNIANINTPNYKSFDLIMNDKLQEPKLILTQTPARENGNSVNLDLEMSKLTENQLMFQALTTLLAKKIIQLNTVIEEGRS